MRDIAITTDNRTNKEWYLDIDIIDGYPRLLIDEQTSDQRAAIAAIQMQGTIPGMLGTGVDWAQLYVNNYQDGLINIDNQIKKAIQDTAYTEGGISQQYAPQYTYDDNQIGLIISKIGGMSQ